MPSKYDITIIQDSSMATASSPSSASSYTQTNSSDSIRSFGTTTTNYSDSQTVPSLPLPCNAVKTPQPVRGNANSNKEFVETGTSRGGNPKGGPERNPAGYIRETIGNVIVHNTGGQMRGNASIDLGPEYENGPEHSEECRKRSRWSDNRGLCFCPPKEG